MLEWYIFMFGNLLVVDKKQPSRIHLGTKIPYILGKKVVFCPKCMGQLKKWFLDPIVRHCVFSKRLPHGQQYMSNWYITHIFSFWIFLITPAVALKAKRCRISSFLGFWSKNGPNASHSFSLSKIQAKGRQHYDRGLTHLSYKTHLDGF